MGTKGHDAAAHETKLFKLTDTYGKPVPEMTKSNQKVQEITNLLKRKYNPSKLFLFGSQATKTAAADSDFDFVMVIPRYTGDRMKTWEECRELIRQHCGVLADVFTYSESEFNQSIKEFSSIPETALNTGKEINLGAT